MNADAFSARNPIIWYKGMRIIAGEFGSRRIQTPSGTATRPTLDKTRESLFSILSSRLAGARVLDLFAGSGALGLEAISRGAAHADFCDKSRQAAIAIEQNISSLQVENRTRLLHMDWSQALRNLAGECARYDLIFLDPPYQTDYTPILKCITDYGLLTRDGLLVAEHDVNKDLSLPEGMAFNRHKDYRETRIDFIHAERPT